MPTLSRVGGLRCGLACAARGHRRLQQTDGAHRSPGRPVRARPRSCGLGCPQGAHRAAETIGLPAGRAAARSRTGLLRVPVGARYQRLLRHHWRRAGCQEVSEASAVVGWGMLVLAAISYSRVYVGVHYPTDVVAGAGLGIACGWIGAWCVMSIGSRLGRPDRSEKTGNPHEELSEVQYRLGR
jgi:hypothetical protein